MLYYFLISGKTVFCTDGEGRDAYMANSDDDAAGILAALEHLFPDDAVQVVCDEDDSFPEHSVAELTLTTAQFDYVEAQVFS
jgi:hypothetical protein